MIENIQKVRFDAVGTLIRRDLLLITFPSTEYLYASAAMMFAAQIFSSASASTS